MIEKVVLRYKGFIERHKISPNGEKPKMLIAGAGTLMLAILFRLLNEDWQVDAYDALQEMLDEGVRRMTLEYILAMSEIAASVDPSLGGTIRFIDDVIKKIEELAKQHDEKVADILNWVAGAAAAARR